MFNHPLAFVHPRHWAGVTQPKPGERLDDPAPGFKDIGFPAENIEIMR
jgi:hypothetical protein